MSNGNFSAEENLLQIRRFTEKNGKNFKKIC